MATSPNDIELIERYLDKSLDPGEALAFATRMKADTGFARSVREQKDVRRLVRIYCIHRRKQQTKMLHDRFYNDPARRTLRLAIDALFQH